MTLHTVESNGDTVGSGFLDPSADPSARAQRRGCRFRNLGEKTSMRMRERMH